MWNLLNNERHLTLKKCGGYEMQKCTSCGGNSFVKVPEFEKELTVCLDCGEVVSIRFVNTSMLKKYKNRDNLPSK
ncbi:hypothetical protein FZC84_09135 [Rossellomorea vietnamensis]|uniref:Uncharacterized protein n=1 Tax=Rossellomorea vietnamensis TaxID=218284 RepID=A0A5D4ME48_9BACI|nr:hypothetical protein FZC84_09135 [Rossellomorea vietnamensis]